jgi:hypothetical protein
MTHSTQSTPLAVTRLALRFLHGDIMLPAALLQ